MRKALDRRVECCRILPRLGGVPERPKGSDCKSDVYDFEGSNPSPSTIFKLEQQDLRV